MIKQPKSMQIKRRYLLLNTSSKEAIEKILLDSLGTLGYSRALPSFVTDGNRLILAIERGSLGDVRASFELSKERIRILKVSGTIKSLLS